MTKLQSLIEDHEGRVPYAYQDSLGYWTIGVGHLIDRRKGGSLPDHIIDALFEHDLTHYKRKVEAALPWFKELDEVRQAVLVDMAFNLGITGLLGFQKTLTAVRERRWKDAAAAMLQSRWAQQVGRRALRLSDMMRSGLWPGDVFVGPF